MNSQTKESVEPSSRSDITVELDELGPLNAARSEQADGTSDPDDDAAERLIQVSLSLWYTNLQLPLAISEPVTLKQTQ